MLYERTDLEGDDGKMVIKGKDYIQIPSKRNHFSVTIGTTKKYSLLGGIEIFKDADWWQMRIGLNLIIFYISVNWRWRVFGCGYDRKDKDDIFWD